MFGFERKKKPIRKPPRAKKDPEAKLKGIAQKKLIDRFLSGSLSPAEERAVILKSTGFNLEPSDDNDAEIRDIALRSIREDPEFRKQAVAAYIDSMKARVGPENSSEDDVYNGGGGGRLEEIVDNMAIEAVQSNPKLVEGAVKARISEMFGGGNGDSDQNSMLTVLDQADEIKKRLGGDNGGGGIGKTFTDILAALAPVVLSMMQNQGQGQDPIQAQPRQPAVSQRTFIVIGEDGVSHEVPESEARRMLAKPRQQEKPIQLVKPVGPEQLIPTEGDDDDGEDTEGDFGTDPFVEVRPEEDDKTSIVSGIEDVLQEAKIPSGSFSINMWIEYLDKEPSAIIDELVRRQAQADTVADDVLGIIALHNADNILMFLQAFKENPEYSDSVIQLEEHREWLQQAIDYYRDSVLGNDESNNDRSNAGND